jgi:copper(I)-binding protein
VNRGGRKVTRWNRRLLFGALAMLVPALAGCEAGFNAPTLQYHPANFTANTMQHGISVSDLFVLDTANNGEGVAGGRAGVFLSLYAQNDDRLVSVSAPDTASSVKIAGGSVTLPADAVVDLSGPVPKVVLTGLTNPLQAGGTVTMSFTFAKAGTITIAVPVEPKSSEYATYSPPAIPNPAPSARPKPTKTTPVPGASGTASNSVGGATGSATATASASNSIGP